MTSTGNIPPRFPYRLHELLEDAAEDGKDDIVSWSPCGTLFTIHKRMEFANSIMPKYCRHSIYKSFLRQLSMYQFQRIGTGESRRSYYHPHFQRGRFDLICLVKRKQKEPMQKLDSSFIKNKQTLSSPLLTGGGSGEDKLHLNDHEENHFDCSKQLNLDPAPAKAFLFQKYLNKNLSSVLTSKSYSMESAQLLMDGYSSGVSTTHCKEDAFYGGLNDFMLEPTPLDRPMPLNVSVDGNENNSGCTKRIQSPAIDFALLVSEGDKDDCGDSGGEDRKQLHAAFQCHRDIEIEPTPFEPSFPTRAFSIHSLTSVSVGDQMANGLDTPLKLPRDILDSIIDTFGSRSKIAEATL